MMRTFILRSVPNNLSRGISIATRIPSITVSSRVQAFLLVSHRQISPNTTRAFSMLHPRHYDGVYKELKSMKHQKPWLQALRERDEAIAAGATHDAAVEAVAAPAGKEHPPLPSEEELHPKKMKDSYFELVSVLFLRIWCSQLEKKKGSGRGI